MFSLIPLPYALDALEPVISSRTLEFHHGKHLQAYVDNLNKLIAGTKWETQCHFEQSACHSERSLCHSERSEESSLLAEILRNASPGPLFNNAGQVLNHNLYFTQFKAPRVIQDDARVILSEAKNLSAQIEAQWGSFDAFKAEFEQKGTTLFGSGWVWLQANASGELSIAQYSGADNPIAHGLKPILTFDVWEHAYYLDYQNRRAAHLAALWQILDWSVMGTRAIIQE